MYIKQMTQPHVPYIYKSDTYKGDIFTHSSDLYNTRVYNTMVSHTISRLGGHTHIGL